MGLAPDRGDRVRRELPTSHCGVSGTRPCRSSPGWGHRSVCWHCGPGALDGCRRWGEVAPVAVVPTVLALGHPDLPWQNEPMASGVPADLWDCSRLSGGTPGDMNAFSWHNESLKRTAAGEFPFLSACRSGTIGSGEAAGWSAAVVYFGR